MSEIVDAALRTPTRSSRRLRIHEGGRIFLSGAAAAIAIVLATLVVLSPLTATRDDLRRIATDGVPLQAQLLALRTTVVDWQFFIERHLDALVPGAVADPTQLVKGAQLVAQQTAEAAALSQHLRRVGLTSDAQDLDAAMKAFTKSLGPLSPVASGVAVANGKLQTIVNAERAAIEHVWALTTQVGDRISRDITRSETSQAADHLTLGLWFVVAAIGLELLFLIAVTLLFGLRAGRREHERHDVGLRHAFETRVQQALEMTTTESDVYQIVGEALHESVSSLKVEMLIADSSRAHFRRALSNDGDFEGCAVTSPLGCPAANMGHALMFPSSGAIDACPHLKNRPSGACSAACFPVSIAGRTVGVTHAIGRDGRMPAESDIDAINFTSRRGSERIAMIRAFATSEIQAQTDPLTGLLNRRSLENSVRDLRIERVPFAVAYGDLDHFKILNDTHGHEAGDQALRLFARVLTDSLRPGDVAARYGGEEFVIVLPDCSTDVAIAVLERVRETLAITLSSGHVPPFTVTFGVASSEYADEFDEVVAIADHALLGAKQAGRNRVALAEMPSEIVSGA